MTWNPLAWSGVFADQIRIGDLVGVDPHELDDPAGAGVYRVANMRREEPTQIDGPLGTTITTGPRVGLTVPRLGA